MHIVERVAAVPPEGAGKTSRLSSVGRGAPPGAGEDKPLVQRVAAVPRRCRKDKPLVECGRGAPQGGRGRTSRLDPMPLERASGQPSGRRLRPAAAVLPAGARNGRTTTE